MDFKILNQFKSLKRIKINDGQPSSLLEAGMLELLLYKFPKDIKYLKEIGILIKKKLILFVQKTTSS